MLVRWRFLFYHGEVTICLDMEFEVDMWIELLKQVVKYCNTNLLYFPVIDDDEDYLGFESPLALNPSSLLQDEGFQEALRATPIGKKPSLVGNSSLFA